MSRAFYIDALTFLVSMACVLFIRAPAQIVEGRTNVATVVRNLRAGARHIFDTASLRSLFVIYIFVFILFGQWNSLQLPFALRALNATELDYGLLEALGAVGFAVGSLALAQLADRLREGQWITISFVGMALAGLVFSFSNVVWLALTMGALLGLLNAPSVIARRLIIQRNTPREMRGRVASAFIVTRDVVWVLGMAAAGLADVADVRLLLIVNSLIFVRLALASGVLPGLGQPAAEWKRAMTLLRGAKLAPGLGVGRAATLADFDLLAARLPALSGLSAKDRQNLAAQTLVADAPAGTVILRKGEASDAAYFIVEGRAVAGWDEEGGYRPLETLNAGDFFGEIAALTGMPRTANVMAEQPTTVLQVPAAALRQMTGYPPLNRLFVSKMTERMARMNMLDLPRVGRLDQQALRELRTPEPQAA